MGTSRRRTPPAPVSAGPPRGARTARVAAGKKLAKADSVSGGSAIFWGDVNRWLRIIAAGAGAPLAGREKELTDGQFFFREILKSFSVFLSRFPSQNERS